MFPSKIAFCIGSFVVLTVSFIGSIYALWSGWFCVVCIFMACWGYDHLFRSRQIIIRGDNSIHLPEQHDELSYRDRMKRVLGDVRLSPPPPAVVFPSPKKEPAQPQQLVSNRPADTPQKRTPSSITPPPSDGYIQ